MVRWLWNSRGTSVESMKGFLSVVKLHCQAELSRDQLIGQVICPVEVGNIDLIFDQVKPADGAVIEHEPGPQSERRLPPGKLEHGAHQAHKKTSMANESHAMDRMSFLILVTGE